ncbi:hypothetical protein [Roseateles aquatilis]|uniref:hypothetical protein n=1 Tax=Roseateles aquatilis TaxID=431061 RepID=UPI001303E7E5|nr:hypothetical protein [Roseateles aquatilis]
MPPRSIDDTLGLVTTRDDALERGKDESVALARTIRLQDEGPLARPFWQDDPRGSRR